LSKLATERNVSASSQNQALCALLFLYKHVLGAPLEHMPELVRARRPENLPVVLSRNEAHRVLQAMSGTKRLMAALLYGGGLRLSECCALRVQDIDFERKQVCVRRGKGRKDRMTLLPANLVKPLQQHLVSVQRQHHADLKADAGHVELPEALARKSPTASLSWSWQWVFPATQVSTRRDRPTATAPLARNCAAEGRTDGDVQSWHQQARQLPLVSPLVCDGATHGGLRHPNDSEVARTQHQTNRLPRLCWLRMNGHNTRSSSIRARGQPQ
jgi:integrase